MFTKCLKLTKKRAVIIILIIAAIMIAATLLLSEPGCSMNPRELINVSSIQGREKYLNSLGWEIDCSSEEISTILIPKDFNDVMYEYAKMQTEQGYDFAAYAGLECKQFTYIVTNYSDYKETVYAVLYVKSGAVIGGDIHSAGIDGFMHGIR